MSLTPLYADPWPTICLQSLCLFTLLVFCFLCEKLWLIYFFVLPKLSWLFVHSFIFLFCSSFSLIQSGNCLTPPSPVHSLHHFLFFRLVLHKRSWPSQQVKTDHAVCRPDSKSKIALWHYSISKTVNTLVEFRPCCKLSCFAVVLFCYSFCFTLKQQLLFQYPITNQLISWAGDFLRVANQRACVCFRNNLIMQAEGVSAT